MNVRELISLLATHPLDLRVVVNGYEDGYDDIVPERVSVVRVELDVGRNWWEGRHGAVSGTDPRARGASIADALVLRRPSMHEAAGR
ncbi:MAG: hypothetical protein OXF01_02225 [Gemmatimonadetes bacterium]|nr:hypothetical protein [Gemmatimonadota bacterium]